MRYQIRKSCFETNSSSMHSLIMTKKNSNVRMTRDEIRDEYFLNENWYKERQKNMDTEVVEIDPWYNDYGRSPFEVLCSFRDKLSYAVAEFCGNCYDAKSYSEAEDIFEGTFAPLLTRLIGCDEVKWGKFDTKHFVIYTDVNCEYLDEIEEVPYKKMVEVEKDERANMSEDDIVSCYYKNVDVDGRPIEDAWFDVPEFGSIDHQSCGLLEGFLERNGLSLEDYLVRKDVVVIIDGDEYHELDALIDCGLINEDSIVLKY